MQKIESNDLYKFAIYRAPNGNHIIEIDPNLEGWILRVARIEHLDVTKFGFTNDESEFHREVSIKKQRFTKLLDSLLHSNHLRKLKELFEQYYF